jgi:dipeptidase
MNCTQGMVLGLTSEKGNMNAQNGDDSASDRSWEHTLVKLIVPKKGYRYLAHERSVELPDFDIPTLNEKGVSATETGKFSLTFPPYPGKAEYLYLGDLMRTSGSAREYVEKWEQNFTKYGYISCVGRTIVDPKEGYYIEGVNYAFGDPQNHAVHGPMTDQVFAAGNFFVSERLKQYELGIGSGYNRAKRVWQLLIDRQYDCTTEVRTPTSEGGYTSESGITLPYFMSVWKDHGNISPEEQRKSSYIPEERGALTVCCHGAAHFTARCFLSVSVEHHTNLLSCMWITFGQPCVAPFLPFYIGVDEIPEIANTRSNPLAQVFENLRLALDYHPEYRAEITRYFSIFEQQTIDQAEKMEIDVINLADKGKATKARKLVTEFVAKKCNEALEMGSSWEEFLKSQSIPPQAAAKDKSKNPS